MNESTFTIRLMKSDDFGAVVGIDEKGLKASRPGYFEMKFEKLFGFMDHLRKVGVQKVCTLVDWNDSKLIHFFSANHFSPSKTINLERSLEATGK